MKKLMSLTLVVLLLFLVALTASAAPDPVTDEADLLTDQQEWELTQLLGEQGIGTLCVVTVDSLEGEDIEDYAESWAEEAGVGVVFLIAMQERKWCITASGEYEGAIDGYVIDRISAACVPLLQAGEYYGAFAVFAQQCGDYLKDYDPTEVVHTPGSNGGALQRMLICLVIGLAAGGITAGIMVGKNRSVRPKHSAVEYIRSGSMNVNVSRDIFLYHHVSRIPKPQNNSSSGGGGGSRSTRSGGF